MKLSLISVYKVNNVHKTLLVVLVYDIHGIYILKSIQMQGTQINFHEDNTPM